MEQNRGILWIADPMDAAEFMPPKVKNTDVRTLIFDENGRYLSLAQEALWNLRRECGWVCVAAAGWGSVAAAALAVQLPVDRLAITEGRIFSAPCPGLPRELKRLQAYTRRNLPLMASEVILSRAREAEIRGFLRSIGVKRLCAQEADFHPEQIVAPWESLRQNNLLIPWKCV